MPKQVKSLLASCQDSLTKSLDVLSEVGCVPYSLLKDSLKHATPQQLYRIERANPDLALESDELWLKHCLLFKDIRDDFEQGLHRNPKEWRELYLHRYTENERKRQAIKERVASQYSKIKNEKAARSIKVLHGIVPTTKGRTYEAARQSTMSKLFQQTKREASKAASIYQQPKRSTAAPTIPNRYYGSSNSNGDNVIRAPKPPSKLIQAYQSNYAKFPSPNSPPSSASPMLAPVSRPIVKSNSKEKIVKRPKLNNDSNSHKSETKVQPEKKSRPAAIVNFNIFNELS